ncbi:hypothetical protein GCM10027341_41340 [Spirosoma knui]
MRTDSGLLLQTLPHAIFSLDKDGYINFANAAACHITQYGLSELLGQHISLLYSPTSDTIKAEYELDLTRKNGQFIAQGWRHKKDQTRFWGEITLSCLMDERSTFIGYCCLLEDRSQAKQQELYLLKQEERYRLMVEGVKDYAIFMLDTEGHISTWNEGAKSIKGYSSSEILGKHFSIFYTSEDLATQKPARELVIACQTGKYEEEGWRVKKNGAVFWANIVITALYNEQNQHIGFSKVTRDLTERKQAQETLLQSEEQYRSLVEQITDYGIFMLDEKGRVINWNEGARRIKGYTTEEIIGKYFSIFYPENDIIDGKPARELTIALATGKYEEEGWRIRKDGSSFWANVVITAVYNAQGVHIGFSKVTRDLTERKQVEEALRESYERYRQLNIVLQASNAELAAANEELEKFTSIVSHDLQEPLRTIKSFLLLTQQELEPEARRTVDDYINKSIQASSRMKELIQYLLHYSQLSKDELRLEELNVQSLVGEVLENVKASTEVSQAQVDLHLGVDRVWGNRLQLIQLLQNLVNNALKFTAGKTPHVTISTQLVDDQVKFSVSDNGIGIADDDLTKVFDVFRRLHTPKDYPGVGIGLAICKKVVERHGGQIWLESELGKGTTFYFTLNQAGKLLKE